jgi:hypothetical protein
LRSTGSGGSGFAGGLLGIGKDGGAGGTDDGILSVLRRVVHLRGQFDNVLGFFVHALGIAFQRGVGLVRPVSPVRLNGESRTFGSGFGGAGSAVLGVAGRLGARENLVGAGGGVCLNRP